MDKKITLQCNECDSKFSISLIESDVDITNNYYAVCLVCGSPGASLDEANLLKGGEIMDKDKIAMAILEELDEVMTINWNMKDTYIKAIKKGIEKGQKLGN